MFSKRKPPLQISWAKPFLFLWHPKVSLMSLFLGLKETFGGVVTELGRSRPPHNAKATRGRRQPTGERSRHKSNGASRGAASAARIGREQPPEERRRRGHVFWPRRPQTLVRPNVERPAASRPRCLFAGCEATVKMLRRISIASIVCFFRWGCSSRAEGAAVTAKRRPKAADLALE